MRRRMIAMNVLLRTSASVVRHQARHGQTRIRSIVGANPVGGSRKRPSPLKSLNSFRCFSTACQLHQLSNGPLLGSQSSHPISIYDMDASLIRQIKSIDELASLVKQLEDLPALTAADLGPLVTPLIRRTCEVVPEFRKQAAELTERIFWHCERLSEELTPVYNLDAPRPTSSMYNRVIIGWGSLRNREGAERADQIFQYMQQQADCSAAVSPCRRCYKSLIRAWAISGEADGPTRAYQYLLELEQLSGVSEVIQKQDGSPLVSRTRGKNSLKPDRNIYNMVLSAYAKSRRSDLVKAMQQVRGITSRMDRLHELTGDLEFALDGYSYHSILQMYSRFIAYSNRSMNAGVAREVEQILYRSATETRSELVPSIEKGVSLDWAHGVLVDALIASDMPTRDIPRAHDTVLSMAGKLGDESLNGWVLMTWPQQATLIRMAKAWQRSELPESSERIDEILELAVEAPYKRIYELNGYMEEWIDSGLDITPWVLEAMLERAMTNNSVKTQLTGQSFAIVMRAWLKSSSDEAPHRCELLLQQLMELCALSRGTTRFDPREAHLRYVMTTWLNRCRDGQRMHGLAGYLYPAEHIERLVHKLSQQEPWTKHMTGLYALAIRSWSLQESEHASEQLDQVLRAKSLLDELQRRSPRQNSPPSAFCCNHVLEACCRPGSTVEQRHQAYHTAIDTFRNGQRNSRTFALILRVLRLQAPELDTEHLDVMEGLFHECCAEGLLTQDMVREMVHSGLGPDVLMRVFGVSYDFVKSVQEQSQHLPLPDSLLIRRLPQAWSCNVKDPRRRQEK